MVKSTTDITPFDVSSQENIALAVYLSEVLIFRYRNRKVLGNKDLFEEDTYFILINTEEKKESVWLFISKSCFTILQLILLVRLILVIHLLGRGVSPHHRKFLGGL